MDPSTAFCLSRQRNVFFLIKSGNYQSLLNRVVGVVRGGNRGIAGLVSRCLFEYMGETGTPAPAPAAVAMAGWEVN